MKLKLNVAIATKVIKNTQSEKSNNKNIYYLNKLFQIDVFSVHF